jgi:hypothetical protein
MSTWDRQSYYYSGQGVLMIGDRDALGAPAGLVPVGNVPELTISVDETNLEHKESQSGQRAIDLRLNQETNVTVAFTVENVIAENLAVALRGNVTIKNAGSVTNESPLGYFGKVTPLENLRVSTVVVGINAVTLTPYVDDNTPWDYKTNTDAGSLYFNDGLGAQLFDKLADDGVAITAVSVATNAVVSIANTAGVVVGGYVGITAVTGTMSTVLNDRRHLVVSFVANTSVTINTSTVALAYTSGGELETDGFTLDVDYSYAAQQRMDALTQGTLEKYVRFEGLNTADGNSPVVVDVFRLQASPLQELALITEDLAQFQIEGNALADSLRTSGSKFFNVRTIR